MNHLTWAARGQDARHDIGLRPPSIPESSRKLRTQWQVIEQSFFFEPRHSASAVNLLLPKRNAYCFKDVRY
jgi:hypothetical protein